MSSSASSDDDENRIQAELILGTIARRETKIGDLDGDYLEDRVSFSKDKLMDANSKAVMMAWEKPLMEAHAKALCSRGGHILNIGFGMGLVDTAIQQYKPVTHIIVEAHPEVYERMRLSGWTKKENVKVVCGRWQDVVHQLESYDGIFFDTYGEYYEDLREFHQHLPSLLNPGGIYSFFNGLCGVMASRVLERIRGENRERKGAMIDEPLDCETECLKYESDSRTKDWELWAEVKMFKKKRPR
ncbi:hypothetical protein L1887_19693 [Cichorium endivia]|nr:hypothetical protein L1887_19693 [Cichorium endivia]